MPEPANIGACVDYARRRLPRMEADLLVCRALEVPHGHLYAFTERAVGGGALARLTDWIRRRAGGEPVAYILGEQGFWGLDLEVSPAALIPRPDTETLVAAALPHISTGARVLDLGTGCGAVALAIATERPGARIVATDLEPRCVELCRRNAARLGLDVDARVADCFDGITERFDVIVSNPPYVGTEDPHLSRGDPRFEPRRALVGGRHGGLEFINRLVRDAPPRLRPGGWLCIEHGWTQGGAVYAMFRDQGYTAIRGQRDIEGRPRVTVGCFAP